MRHSLRARRGWIGLVTAVVVSLAACGPPFPTTPQQPPSPRSVTPTTTTTPVPPTVLPASDPLECPAGSTAAGTGSTVPLVVDDPLEGAELFTETIDAAGDAVTEPDPDGSALAPSGERTVAITSVVDGTPVIDTVAVSDSLAAAADASTVGEVVAVEAVSSVSTLQEPDGTPSVLGSNDSLRGKLWAFDELEFERSWQCGTGGGVSVAVVDSGVLGSHPDLIGRVTPGWTKLTSDAGTVGGGNVDPHGHGTHVAGTVGATAGNSLGVAGVAPDVTIVPVRVLREDGNGSNANVAAGIVWAVDHGVDVINLSLGGTAATEAVRTALIYAAANDVVVFAAAGNEGLNQSPAIYPAAFDESIAVAAVDRDLTVAGYSNRGDYVDVAAPGSGIVSTFNDGGYASSDGTSMATPHVAGLAAVLLSAEPDLTAVELRARIVGSVDDAGVPGLDQDYGHGIINPVRALTGG